MKNLVIYHKADFDGIFSREIAKMKLGTTDTEYIGWDYGDPSPTIPEDCERIYMIDISVEGMMDDPRLIWIDHHKSAIEKFRDGKIVRGCYYLIDGVAACRLAWQFFFAGKMADSCDHYVHPEKEDYVDRKVQEPLAVRLAGEYDIWDKRDSNAELFQHGLRSQEITEDLWHQLLSDHDGVVGRLLQNGLAVQYAKTKENESIALNQGFTFQWEELTFLGINAARYNSHLFTAGLKPEHDACFGFNFDGPNRVWKVSLYHAPGKEHHDLSLIAVKNGGGGHRGACGFKTKQLPFLT